MQGWGLGSFKSDGWSVGQSVSRCRSDMCAASHLTFITISTGQSIGFIPPMAHVILLGNANQLTENNWNI